MPIGKKISQLVVRVRASVPLLAMDALLAAAAYCLVLLLRVNGEVANAQWHAFRLFIPLALVVHLVANRVAGLYGQMWRYAGIAEARRVIAAGFASGAILLAASFLLWNTHMPRSVIALGALVATFFLGGVRFQSRLFAFNRGLTRQRSGIRVAVVGAGEVSASLVREMLNRTNEGLVPVVLIDEDVRKHGLAIRGVPVVGGTRHLSHAIRKYGAQQVVLAVPNADRALIQRVAAAADHANVPLRMVTGVNDDEPGAPSVRNVRNLRIEDLLGRNQVVTDLDSVRAAVEARTVLITGAGSIGSEIAQQVAQLEPDLVVLLDHDETHIHDAAASLNAPTTQVLADVRDRELISDVFTQLRPNVVFHAAAHKHVPLLEEHPCEAITTNVLGTANVLDAAIAADVERFVFISTDKAVRPTSVMGASKWIGEQLVLSRAPAGARYCSVRFGNVLGSRGSVIPTFTRQIDGGGPVTVTNPSMTRFFMSAHEAVQLVLQASVFVEGGEVFMLEMGSPINIRELAERMIRLSGRTVGSEVPIRITGMRPGEKLHEELCAPDERAEPTAHESIVRLQPVALPAEVLDDGVRELAQLACSRRDFDVTCALFDLVAAGADRRLSNLVDVGAVEHMETMERSEEGR